jgi:hypothetical protein
MSDFFANHFFPGPALGMLGIFIAIATYFNWNELATASVQVGLPSANALPGLVGIFATMVSTAGFIYVVVKRQ